MRDYEAMGNEMTARLGLEDKRVILYWKAYEDQRWIACDFHYGCFKKMLTL